MNNDQQPKETKQDAAEPQKVQGHDQQADHTDLDGLADKKPEELTPEELRLMADTMPGEGPGD